MCWHEPTARRYTGQAMLKAPASLRYPSWALNALGGITATIDPTVQCAAKTIGLTLLDLITKTQLRDSPNAELQCRLTGAPIAPLCDYLPPIHFRWPEYVTTVRGEDWWPPSHAI